MPPISIRIQEELGSEICGDFHIHSNCPFLQTDEYKNSLVVSSAVSSSKVITKYNNQDRVAYNKNPKVNKAIYYLDTSQGCASI